MTDSPPLAAAGAVDTPAAAEPRLVQIQAGPMANFVYVLGDSVTRKAWVVDPAWEPLGIVKIAGEQGYEVTGVLATHFHQDHIGGEIMGQHIPGVRELRAEFDLPPGTHGLVVRAWDSAANSQPETIASTWNFKGYVNNAWHRIRITLK